MLKTSFFSLSSTEKKRLHLFLPFLGGEESMAEIKLNFISENAEVICWTPHI